MNDTDWAAWTEYHGTLFWMKTADDLAMFREWRTALANYTLAELREASLWIASDQIASAAFRSRHLGLLHGRIQSRRFARRQAEIDAAARAMENNLCKLCNGSGLVAVPHMRCVVNGLWVYPYSEQVVACNCNLGRFKLESTSRAISELNARGGRPKKNFDLIGLERYEFVMQEHGVDWVQLFEQRKATRESNERAAWLASNADKNSPIDVRKVMDRIGRKQEATQ